MKTPKIVLVWLYLGLFMVFMQVFIGGVTRLTGSGLSITKWEIVTGTFPPMSDAGWQSEFELYKETPQYKKINEGMSIKDFKFIYFWEYFHRLWARMMGFIFLIPFIFFALRGMLSKDIKRSLLYVVLAAAITAVFGWIMVASGLVDRPWVNAYKLTLHLGLGFTVFGLMFWTVLVAHGVYEWSTKESSSFRMVRVILIVVSVQIFFGGIMSGTKAGLFFPTWPDIGGYFMHPILLDMQNWTWDNFVEYDRNLFAPALFHFIHRSLAYLIVVIVSIYSFKLLRTHKAAKGIRRGVYAMVSVLVVQVVLGVLTVLSCEGLIPVGLGSLHQICALLLLGTVLFLLFHTNRSLVTDKH